MLELIAAGIGKGIDAAISHNNANKNRDMQREFAKNSIQWKVEDAQKAGIHPLAALGAQVSSPSPVTVGTDFGSLGQDVSRAINATRTQPERNDAISKTYQDLEITNKTLQNELLKSQINKINASINPPFPAAIDQNFIPGQGNSPLNEKLEDPQRTRHIRTPDGYITTNPNLSDAQAIEDRWGEWVGDIYGVRNWWNEAGQHLFSKRRLDQLSDDYYNKVRPKR